MGERSLSLATTEEEEKMISVAFCLLVLPALISAELSLGFSATNRGQYVSDKKMAYLLDEPLSSGHITSIEYWGKKKKSMNFWLMRPAGGTKYTAIEMEKHKASKTGVNSFEPNWRVEEGDKIAFSGKKIEIPYSIEDMESPFHYRVAKEPKKVGKDAKF